MTVLGADLPRCWDLIWRGSHSPDRGMDTTGDHRLDLGEIPAVFVREIEADRTLRRVELRIPADLAQVYRHLRAIDGNVLTPNSALTRLGMLSAYGRPGVALLRSAGWPAVDAALTEVRARAVAGLPLRASAP